MSRHLDEARASVAVLQEGLKTVQDAIDQAEQVEEHASHLARKLILVSVVVVGVGVAVMVIKKRKKAPEDQ